MLVDVELKGKPCNFEACLCGSFYSTFKTYYFKPYAFYNKRLQTLRFEYLFNLAYRRSFSWHTRLKKPLRIWVLLWWIAKLIDYFVKSNDATLHLTITIKRNRITLFSIAFDFVRNGIGLRLNWLLIFRNNWPRKSAFKAMFGTFN